MPGGDPGTRPPAPPSDPALDALIAAWPNVTDEMKAAILALAQASAARKAT